ncbi:MAG: pre-peptidase C-terminal domain-containing protein [Bacteroidales bacterium]|nr:pre-peptidase C-terminal domain-containing protein [Bacteroidales bacterium]
MEKLSKTLLSAVCIMTICSGLATAQQRAAVPGYYKDIFMDGGIKLTSRTTLPVTDWLNLSLEYLATQRESSTFSPIYQDTIHQNKIILGSPEDLNGALLYPDGAPRFRMIYINGGKAGEHGNSLTERGRQIYRDFLKGGGSVVGTCAGAYISSKGSISDGKPNLKPTYIAMWPGWVHSTGLEKSYTGMFVPKDSPLLKYASFKGNHIDSVRHNGGCYMYEQELPEGTEILTYFDYEPLTANGTRSIHRKVATWAWKENDQTGRIVLCGSHPEGIESGERLLMMSGMLQYAIAGNGQTRLKGELKKGEEREMLKSTADNDPDYTMIGDRQYHHFKFTLPKGAKNITVTLTGDISYDLFLYLNKGDFAFRGKAPYADISKGGEKVLKFDTLEAGEWYVAVECNSTVETIITKWGVEYVGDTTVLNGVPYYIEVNWE